MPRKFDKYGWNRQFKWQPVSKRHPFPYRLPFVDDFSDTAAYHKVQVMDPPDDDNMSDSSVNSPDILDPEEYFKMVQRRRNRTKQFRELHGGLLPFPKRAKTSHAHSTVKAFGAGAAVVGTTAGIIFAPEIGLAAAAAFGERQAATTVARRQFIRGKLPDALRRWSRRAVKAYRLQKKFRTSNKTGYRIARRVAKRAWKYA